MSHDTDERDCTILAWKLLPKKHMIHRVPFDYWKLAGPWSGDNKLDGFLDLPHTSIFSSLQLKM